MEYPINAPKKIAPMKTDTQAARIVIMPAAIGNAVFLCAMFLRGLPQYGQKLVVSS